jgi:hypothetical protein
LTGQESSVGENQGKGEARLKSKNIIIRFALLFACLTLATAVYADVKVKTRQTASGQTQEVTTYIKGKRQRSEQSMGNLTMVNLTQCDLKRSVQLMPQSQTYLITSWEPSQASVQATSAGSATPQGGTVTSTITTKDTGERKQMFGYTARHLVITIETEPSPDACNQQKSKMQMEGWYIDAPFALDCETERYSNYSPANTQGCRDRYEVKQVGAMKRGFAVWEKTTMFDASGKEIYSMTNEVIELSNTPLDAALFDIPSGYREVNNASELYSSVSPASPQNSSASNSGALNKAGMGQNNSNATDAIGGAPTKGGAKRSGLVRRLGF